MINLGENLYGDLTCESLTELNLIKFFLIFLTYNSRIKKKLGK